MKLNSKLYGFVVLSFCSLLTMLTGCEGLLERDYDDTLTEEMILNNKDYAIGLQTACYRFMPRARWSFNCVDHAMLDCATDDGVYSESAGTINSMVNGSWSANTLVDDQWSTLWQGVRKCNLFLSVADRSVIPNDEVLDGNGLPAEDNRLRDRLKAETYFIRAFIYFDLACRYRDVPMVTEVLGVEDNLDLPRTDFSVIIDSIVCWCDRAAAVLPLEYADMTKGRATKGAALMLKSRALLYAASPLFNPEGNVEKWRQAADAARAVIELSEKNGNLYQLVPLKDIFFREFNDEIIFPGEYAKRNDVESENLPNGFTNGKGRTNPTQNLVDAFEIKVGDTYVEYDPSNADHVARMYSEDRDPRLANTVLFNGASFAGRTIQTYVGGLDGINTREGYTKTGYYLRKFVDPTVNLITGTTRNTAWIHFRYAEALLNYAEAQAHVSLTNEVYDRLNEVRMRSMGEAGKIPYGSLTQPQMIEKIHHERRVEFAFEEFRFWDVRRWKLAESLFNEPVYGIRFDSAADSEGEIFKVQERLFSTPMYFCPIGTMSVEKAPTTGQTPGWM